MIALVIRPAVAADCHELPAVELSAAESFRAAPGLEWLADDGEFKPVDVHRRRVDEGTSWVAELDGEPVGFLCAEIFGRELHVWELAVRQDRQGRGLGRRLIAAAVDDARRRGLDAITLSTFREVPWNEPFYARLGFVRIDDVSGEPRLAAILRSEIEQGLPGERRCAMRLALTAD